GPGACLPAAGGGTPGADEISPPALTGPPASEGPPAGGEGPPAARAGSPVSDAGLARGTGPSAPPLPPAERAASAGPRSAAARCSSETTSLSLVWEKSWYHSPIARKCPGVSRQITSSASAASAVHAEGGA